MGNPHFQTLRRCAFCENKADSKEHAWPNWVLKRFAGTRNQIFGEIDGRPHHDPKQKALKVRCVCEKCNFGWMKQLEDEALPLAGAMMNDIVVRLHPGDQQKLAAWAIKTAMVFEFVHATRPVFFTDGERAGLRRGVLPTDANVQLGRYGGRATFLTFGADGSTTRADLPTGASFVTTMVFNRLAVQVFGLHADHPGSRVTVAANTKQPWQRVAHQVWPQKDYARTIEWPPEFTIGVDLSVQDFHTMWGAVAPKEPIEPIE